MLESLCCFFATCLASFLEKQKQSKTHTKIGALSNSLCLPAEMEPVVSFLRHLGGKIYGQ